MSTQMASVLAHELSFRLGRVTVEPALLLIRGPNGAEFKVEPRVMQVLVALAGAKGGLLSRADLRDACWDGRITSDDAIDRVIARIRRLGAGPGRTGFAVETVPKVGYRLVEQDADGKAAGPRGYSRRIMLGGAVATVAAVGAGVALYETRKRTAPGGGPLTIAVLPFTTETSPALASFAAALSDDLRSDVSRVSDIRVIAQTSSRAAADEERTARQIGRSLGADYLVAGQVGSAGAQVQATVSLVDAASGAQLWTAQETAPSNNPTGLRSAIAGDVIEHLAGIIPISGQRPAPVERPDPQAYALVHDANRSIQDARTNQMRGRQEQALSLGAKAETLARQALAIDPDYSPALVVLAAITKNGWTPELARQNLTTKQRVEASISIVRRALVADPGDPAALTELGDYYRRFAFRWTEAETLFRRALSIDPSFVDAHWSYAYELGTLGRAIEGLDHALSVFELDPRNPFRRIALPRLLYLVGNRAAAMRRYEAELDEQPDNLFLLRELYFLFLAEGNAADLQRLSERLRRQRAATPELAALARRVEAGRLALLGKPQALRALTDAELGAFDRQISNATPQGRARDDLPYIFAIEYAWAGLPERSIDMFERALAAKSLYWPATLPFGIAQLPAAVRQNPRYAALWERDVGLRQLIQSRRAAILSRQTAGFAPDGRKVAPAIPAALQRRVQRALRRA